MRLDYYRQKKIYDSKIGGNMEKKCGCSSNCKCGCNEGKKCTCKGECTCGKKETKKKCGCKK